MLMQDRSVPFLTIEIHLLYSILNFLNLSKIDKNAVRHKIIKMSRLNILPNRQFQGVFAQS